MEDRQHERELDDTLTSAHPAAAHARFRLGGPWGSLAEVHGMGLRPGCDRRLRQRTNRDFGYGWEVPTCTDTSRPTEDFRCRTGSGLIRWATVSHRTEAVTAGSLTRFHG